MSVYSSNRYNKANKNDAWTKIAKFIKPNSRVLDIGCSSGQLGGALKKEKNLYVVGVDIDKDDVEQAKKNLDEAKLLNVEKDDLDALGKFDVIVMADVIEHLLSPETALKRIHKLLKKDGLLVFSIPNMANVTTRIDLMAGRFEYKDFGLLDRTHLHFYDHQEVNRVLTAGGFEVVKTDVTIRDVPDEVLRNELEAIGIKLTPKLKRHLYNTDALTYQFIGSAKVATNPKPFVQTTTSHLDAVSRDRDQLIHDYTGQLLEKTQQLDAAKQELSSIKTELTNILNSKGWKMLSKIHKVKHIITHKPSIN